MRLRLTRWCSPVLVCWSKSLITASHCSSVLISVIYFSLFLFWSVFFLIVTWIEFFCVCFVVGNYLINYLATRGPLPHFVNASLILLLCRVTKFGWFDDDKFREVVKEATDFLSQVGCYAFPCVIALSCFHVYGYYHFFLWSARDVDDTNVSFSLVYLILVVFWIFTCTYSW
jgi:hypothetical protein